MISPLTEMCNYAYHVAYPVFKLPWIELVLGSGPSGDCVYLKKNKKT